MKQLLMRAAVGVLVAGIGATAFACSSDSGGLTLEEYFEEFDKLDQAHQEQDEAVTAQLALLEDTQVPEATDLLNEQIDLIEEFADGADALDAPDEVVEPNDGVVTNLNTAADDFREALGGAGEPATLDELRGAFVDVDFTTLDAVAENCDELVRIAGENDIEVALDCASDGE